MPLRFASGAIKSIPFYIGPGDFAGAAFFWGGLRAYSAGYAGGPAIDVVDSSNANGTTINTLNNGTLDVVTLEAFRNAHGAPSVTTIYDQTLSGHHLSQGTVANMPLMVNVTTSFGTFPAMQFTLGVTFMSSSSQTYPNTQPYSWSMVVQPSAFAITQSVFVSFFNSIGFSRTAANTFGISVYNFTVPANQFNSVQALLDISSVTTNVNGASVSNAGTAGNFHDPDKIFLGGTSSGSFDGLICEAGIWNRDNTAVYSQLNINQYTYWNNGVQF